MFKALPLPGFYSSALPRAAKTKKQFTPTFAKPVLYWASVGLIALNAVLLMSYVIGVNSYASRGFEIKTLQARLDKLTQENKQLALKAAEISSMVSIQTDFLNADFVAAGTPKFLAVGRVSQLTRR